MAAPSPLFRKLSASPLCRGLTPPEVETLIAIAEERRAPKDSAIFEEGDVADVLLVIAMGRVEVSRQKHVLTTLTIGDVLGELSLFSFAHKRSASARALTDVALIALPSHKFRKLIEAHDLAALKVVNNVAHQMSDRLLSLTDQLMSGVGRRELTPLQRSTGRWV